jgi:hypothetical protein
MLCFLAASAWSISDKPYVPDIRLGVLKQPASCTKIVSKSSLVYVNLRATVQGQATPIVGSFDA